MDNGFSSEEIRRIINEIRTSSRLDKESYFRQKYALFFEKFPKLFFASLDPSFDLKFFDLMLKQREQILTTKDIKAMETASQEIHEDLNKKYIYPIFPKEELERMKSEMENATHR